MRKTLRSLLSLGVAVALASAFAPFAYAAPTTDSAPSPETDGVIVVLDQSANDASLLAADDPTETLADAGLAVTAEHDIAGETVLVAQPTDGASDTAAADAVSDLPGVAYAQPNYVYDLIGGIEDETDASAGIDPLGESDASLLAAPLFDDPYAQIENSKEDPNQYWLYRAGFDTAWQSARAEGKVTVATFDSGVLATHPDLADNVIASEAWDSYDNEPLDVSSAAGDTVGHGTHVAGIIAAVANNGQGIAGSSYNAQVLPVKVINDETGRGSSASLIAAYDYLFDEIDSGAVDNVRVVNMSLGGYSDSLNDRALENAIATARDTYGIVTVCAGGNGDQVSKPNTDPIYPADFPECVSVTALNSDGANLAYSDYNEFKDISAAGSGVWSTYIRSSASTDGQLYWKLSGSSMAAPMVSGAFALLFSAVPDATPEEACEAIYATATPVVDSENDRSDVSGSHGELDAAAAVDYLVEHHGTTPEPSAPTFPDVAPGAWYYDAVRFVAQAGIMKGYDENAGAYEGYFDPDASLTRAMAAQILYNYYGNGEIVPADERHTDVDQSAWYAPAVNWAVEHGYMRGLDGTTLFAPDDPLTREQLAIVIDNASTVETIENPDAFGALPDADSASSWAVDALEWAVGNGVINGVEIDPAALPGYRELQPQEATSRAVVAQVFMNAIENGIL